MIKFNNFIDQASISSNLLINQDAKKVFNFLKSPKVVHKMIIFTELDFPVITGIAKELENKFANSPAFPLTRNLNRQIVGKIMKYIMSFYGYQPKNATRSEKRLRKFSQAQLFKSSAVYQKDIDPKLKIAVTIEEA